MKQTAARAGLAYGEPHLVIETLMCDETTAVLELHGVVRRSSVAELAANLSVGAQGGPASVVVDLTGVTLPNHWLLSSLAKAHAVLRARKATMRLVIGDDRTFELLHLAGFDRMAPMFLARHYGDHLAHRVGAHRSRAYDRQRVVDLTEASRGRGRGQVGVMSRHPERWAMRRTVLV